MPKLVLEFGDNNTRHNYRIVDKEGKGLPKDMILEHIISLDSLGQPVWGLAAKADEEGNVIMLKGGFQSLLYAVSYYHSLLTAKPK